MDRVINYLACLRDCAMWQIIALFGIFAATGVFLSILALIGVATLITIPEIWAIVAAAFGIAAATVITMCLISCGFQTAEPANEGGGGGEAAGAIIIGARVGVVVAVLTIWNNWDRFFG